MLINPGLNFVVYCISKPGCSQQQSGPYNVDLKTGLSVHLLSGCIHVQSLLYYQFITVSALLVMEVHNYLQINNSVAISIYMLSLVQRTHSVQCDDLWPGSHLGAPSHCHYTTLFNFIAGQGLKMTLWGLTSQCLSGCQAGNISNWLLCGSSTRLVVCSCNTFATYIQAYKD